MPANGRWDLNRRLKGYSRAEGLDCSCQILGPQLPWTYYGGGVNFGWLAVWVLSPDWHSRKLEVCDVCQALR